MFELDAYLRRVGAGANPSLAELHRAHATSIPFENLDPHRGVHVSLALEDVQRKLVHERRGGYCFEQNLLLKAALEALGAQVQPLLARVRRGVPPGTVRPRTHLLLRAVHAGSVWHADVGFGGGTLLEPLPFGVGDVHEQEGWRFRVVEEGPELVLQSAVEDGWQDLYAFSAQPAPFVDIELSNWFTCSHPSSAFVTGLLITAQRADGTLTVLSDWGELSLTQHTPAGSEVTPVTRAQIPALLAERFDLPGFALDGFERVVRAGDAPAMARANESARP